MSSLAQAMAASPTVFVTEKRNARVKPSLIVIDNALGAADAIFCVVDRFTPAVTAGVPAPVVTTVTRLQVNVAMLACVSLQDELKDVLILGGLEITRQLLVGGVQVADPNCVVTVAWDFI